MLTVFLSDVSPMLAELYDASNMEITIARLLAALIRFIPEQDIGRLRDEGFI